LIELNSLLNNIQSYLNDNYQRWSKSLIINYINEAIRDIAVETKIFKFVTSYNVLSKRNVYLLPDNFVAYDKVTFNDKLLKPLSFNDFNNYPNINGEPQYYIYNQYPDAFAVYPIPYNDYYKNNTTSFCLKFYGHLNSSDFGLIDDMCCYPQTVNADTDFGVIRDIAVSLGLVLYYSGIPDKVTETTDSIDIDKSLENLIIYYVLTGCYRNNLNEQDTQLSNYYFQLYQNKLKYIKNNNHSNKIIDGNAKKYEISYKGFI
jgi:hypothetical protein